MMRRGKSLQFILFILSLMLLLTGCQPKHASSKASASDRLNLPAPSSVPVSVKPSPAPTAAPVKSASPSPAPTAAPTPASPPASTDSTGSKPSDGTQTASEHVNSFDREHLSLFGIHIGEDKKNALQKLGIPSGSFVMQNDTNPLIVYSYSGFSVGFSQNDNKLVFINVSSSEADPELNGLKLGQNAQDAVKDLGSPDTNTGYVYVYDGTNSILKLELEPGTGVIDSIKLFAKP